MLDRSEHPARGDFNCTIQELKRAGEVHAEPHIDYFNCTIQELKPLKKAEDIGGVDIFQLHHTGIKTEGISYKVIPLLIISIAPYRN